MTEVISVHTHPLLSFGRSQLRPGKRNRGRKRKERRRSGRRRGERRRGKETGEGEEGGRGAEVGGDELYLRLNVIFCDTNTYIIGSYESRTHQVY